MEFFDHAVLGPVGDHFGRMIVQIHKNAFHHFLKGFHVTAIDHRLQIDVGVEGRIKIADAIDTAGICHDKLAIKKLLIIHHILLSEVKKLTTCYPSRRGSCFC